MTLPFPAAGSNAEYVARRANWLGRYLAVEKGMDKELFVVLADASKGIESSLLALQGKETASAAIRRLQLSLARKEIRKQMQELFGDVYKLAKSYHSKAAEAAVAATLNDEARILKTLFPDRVSQEQYAKSLRETATRNIEAVMTRVLQTKQPLSKRVYKTRALSQGMVDRAINRGLARGDDYKTIARSVRTLIRPDVPGGVSYAAVRLARTETNNAFHAQSIKDAQDMPWVGQMKWNLSKRHMQDERDPCEDYARQGLFPVEKVPDKPHPNCRCFVTPEPIAYNDFEDRLLQGQYDSYLDDFINSG